MHESQFESGESRNSAMRMFIRIFVANAYVRFSTINIVIDTIADPIIAHNTTLLCSNWLFPKLTIRAR